MRIKDYFSGLAMFIYKGFTSSSVRNFYNSSARFYESAMPMQDSLVSRIVSYMPECDTALDIAMGTGITSSHMSQKCNNLISIDFSDSMIDEARKKNLESCILKGNFLSLPLKDSSVDVAVCTGAVRHIPSADYDRFFLEISRVSIKFLTEARDFTFIENIYFNIYGKLMRFLGHSEQPLNSGKNKICKALTNAGFSASFIPFDGSKRNFVAIGTRLAE